MEIHVADFAHVSYNADRAASHYNTIIQK